MSVDAPRVMVAGTASGCGKTTVACGLMRARARRGLRVVAGKCGPDYLDPLFHERVLGTPSRNLDLFLGNERLVCGLVARGAQHADITVVEGVMGYYDGIATSVDASSYDVARATGTPTVLVVDARGRALSVAAEVLGFVRMCEPSQVAGVILNRVSMGYATRLREAVEAHAGVPVLGYVPPIEEAHLASRHLGLVSADEVPRLQEKVDAVACTLERTVDLDAVLALARTAAPLDEPDAMDPKDRGMQPTIAVARDEAFSFYYADTLELFERLGARLAYFSPVRDACLPEGACGLYLGGGYPELHARELSRNEAMRAAVRDAVRAGMPTIAECGGFLYLHEFLEDDQRTAWPMVGAVLGRGFGTGRLGRFGYVTLTAKRDGLLARAGEELRAHEFHYWDSDTPGDAFVARKPQSDRSWDCVMSSPALHAGFPHLYLAGAPKAARRFVEACAAFGVGKGMIER